MPPRTLLLEPGTTIPEVAVAIERSVQFLSARGVSKQCLYAAELALEELQTNVLKYAHADGVARPFRVEVEDDGVECVWIRVFDEGHAFDPWAAADPVKGKPLLERMPGGQGLMLVRKFCRSCEYERRDGRNCVTVEILRASEAK